MEADEGVKVNVYKSLEFLAKFFQIHDNKKITPQEKRLLIAYHIGNCERGYQFDLRLVERFKLIDAENIDMSKIRADFTMIESGNFTVENVKRIFILENFNQKNPGKRYSLKRFAVGSVALLIVAGIVVHRFDKEEDFIDDIKKVKKPLNEVGEKHVPSLSNSRKTTDAKEKGEIPDKEETETEEGLKKEEFFDHDTIDKDIDDIGGMIAEIDEDISFNRYIDNLDLIERIKIKLKSLNSEMMLPEEVTIEAIDDKTAKLKFSDGNIYGYVRYDDEKQSVILNSQPIPSEVYSRLTANTQRKYEEWS